MQPQNKIFCDDSVAQSVEHIPFKDGVLGSNPSWITKGSKVTQARLEKVKTKPSKINVLGGFSVFCPSLVRQSKVNERNFSATFFASP